MTPSERASLAFQAPDPDPARYPKPGELPVYRVCPHCKQETARTLVSCDGHAFEADRCFHHGDVVAILSHVRNGAS